MFLFSSEACLKGVRLAICRFTAIRGLSGILISGIFISPMFTLAVSGIFISCLSLDIARLDEDDFRTPLLFSGEENWTLTVCALS